MSTNITSDHYYPYADYETLCATEKHSDCLCILFPITFAPIWHEVMEQISKKYTSDLEYDPYMISTTIPYVLKIMYPESFLTPEYSGASFKIRSYLYSLLNDPVKRSRVTPSLVLDLLHNPEDV